LCDQNEKTLFHSEINPIHFWLLLSEDKCHIA